MEVSTMESNGIINQLILGAQGGHWLLVISAALTLLVSALKSPLLGSLVKRIPKRARFAAPLLLAGLAGCLLAVNDGATWGDAAAVMLTTGPGAIGLHHLWDSFTGKESGDPR
jgi:hypothetical protein